MIEEIELWKPIVGFEGKYDISSFGRVRRIYYEKNAPAPPQITAGSMLSKGKRYMRVQLRNPSERRYINRYVHILVASAFVENPKPDVFDEVNHKDGIKDNNRYDNLEWTDHPGNHRHAALTGLRPAGEKCYNSKLTEEQVLEIQKLPRVNQAAVAKRYGVTVGAIQGIQQGKNWNKVGSFKRLPDRFLSSGT